MSASVAQLRARVSGAATMNEAVAQLTLAARILGFDGATYVFSHKPLALDGTLQSQTLRSIDGDHKAFDTIYARREYYRIDPVYQQCLIAPLPVIWTYGDRDHPLPDSGVRLTAGQVELARLCERFGMPNGFAVPLHGPAGELASVNFISKTDPASFKMLVSASMDRVISLSHHFHGVMWLRHIPRPDAGIGSGLSDREIMCLRLVGLGKTNDMIAEILGLAEITVRYHLNNAARKLGACNRSNAVAKAAFRGLLGTIR